MLAIQGYYDGVTIRPLVFIWQMRKKTPPSRCASHAFRGLIGVARAPRAQAPHAPRTKWPALTGNSPLDCFPGVCTPLPIKGTGQGRLFGGGPTGSPAKGSWRRRRLRGRKRRESFLPFIDNTALNKAPWFRPFRPLRVHLPFQGRPICFSSQITIHLF